MRTPDDLEDLLGIETNNRLVTALVAAGIFAILMCILGANQ